MFSQLSHGSFRGKLLLAAITLSLIVPTLGGLYLVNETTISHRRLISNMTTELTSTLSRQIHPALEFDDPETAQEITDALVENDAIRHIKIWKFDIFQPTNKPYLFVTSYSNGENEKNPPESPTPLPIEKEVWLENDLMVQRLIYSQDQKIGTVILVRSLDDLKSMQDEFKKLTFTIWLIIVILVIFAALWIEKSLTKPLIELVSVAERVASEKDLQARAKKMSDDEFGRLTTVFNNMLDSIGEANEKLVESKEQMETRVIERTDDLKKANKRLQSEIKVRIKKNQELLNLQNQLGRQERLANVGQVSSNIAHELRNPMAAIRNSVYFLRNNLSAVDKSLEHLEIIDQQLSASDDVIEHLLNITKGKELKLSAVNLKELCMDVLEVLDLSDQVKFSYNSEPENLELTVDKLLFRQVLSNLFINSIQSNDLISEVEIKVFARKEEEFIEILITDNGTGIPRELQSRVFEPLYTDKEDGFGLGLPLCSDLLARHRGSIEIKESSTTGTTISLKIPN